jgi:hypothetical protein
LFEQDAWQLSFAGDTFNTLWMMKGCLCESLAADFFSGFGADLSFQRQIAFTEVGGIGIASSKTDIRSPPGIYGITFAENGGRSFTYWREAAAARRLADYPEALAASCKDLRLIYLSGITLAIMGPAGRKILLDAIAEAHEGGTRIAFDPAYSPRLWQDAEVARTKVTEGRKRAGLVNGKPTSAIGGKQLGNSATAAFGGSGQSFFPVRPFTVVKPLSAFTRLPDAVSNAISEELDQSWRKMPPSIKLNFPSPTWIVTITRRIN